MDFMSLENIFLEDSLLIQFIVVMLLIMSLTLWSVAFYQLSVLYKIQKEYKQLSFVVDNYKEVFINNLYQYISQYVIYKPYLELINDKNNYQNKDQFQELAAAELTNIMDSLFAKNFILAITANSAPFFGLTGTVFGIISSFTAIGVTQSTSLAAIAPGIASALYLTGLGLITAIPASIFYNIFANFLNRYDEKHLLLIHKTMLLIR